MAKGKYESWLTPDGLMLLEGWARDGLTDEQIAKKCGVNPDTLYTWKKKYPEISEALKKGKELVDTQVENALLKRALGYSYEEVTVEESDNGYKKRVTVKQVVPDTTAQIFWLKNRRPDKWREKAEPKAAESRDNNLLEQMAASAKTLEESEDALREIQPETANQHELVADEDLPGT